MRRWLPGVLLAAGCATVAPMQPASVVSPGAWRVGGQLSAAAFCGSIPGGLLGMTRCTEYPDGIPLPELRANARRGFGGGVDVGGSFEVLGQVYAPERVLQAGLTLDGKREWLRVPTASGLTHVVSAGLLAGSAVSGRLGLAPWAQVEAGVPVFYGLQTARFEVVLSVVPSARWTFAQLGRSGALPATWTQRLELRLGLFRRPAGWAFMLGYLTDPARLAVGAPQVQFGWTWDLAPQ